MSTPANAREARLQRRFDSLTSGDAQLIAAQPDPAITAALGGPGVLLADVIRIVMDGYADRPALGQRAVDFVTDANGRTVAELRPHFDTLTYRETWRRVRALADALADNPVRPGDRVATLGFTSADYAIVDMALSLAGAVAVPLQTSAAVKQLHPILVESEPVEILSSIDHLQDAVELALTAYAPKRLVVFDYHRRSTTTARHWKPPRHACPTTTSRSKHSMTSSDRPLSTPTDRRSRAVTATLCGCSSTPRVPQGPRRARCTPTA